MAGIVYFALAHRGQAIPNLVQLGNSARYTILYGLMGQCYTLALTLSRTRSYAFLCTAIYSRFVRGSKSREHSYNLVYNNRKATTNTTTAYRFKVTLTSLPH